MGLTAQYIAVGMIVLISLIIIIRRQFPQTTRRVRRWLALPLLREGRPAWLRRVGLWLAPAVTATQQACGGCSGCEPGTTQSGTR